VVASESGEAGNPGTLGMTILFGNAKYSFQDELSSRPARSVVERLSDLSRGTHGKGGSKLPRKTARVFRFPTSPAAGASKRLRSSDQFGLGEVEAHLSSFGIETGKQFVSKGDANHFLGFTCGG
jgi:hypothetical protein